MSVQLIPATPSPKLNIEPTIQLLGQKPTQISTESFVDADCAAKFLAITRRHLLQMARSGMIPGYPTNVGTGRRQWRFRLSEIADAITSNANIPVGRKPATVNNRLRQSP